MHSPSTLIRLFINSQIKLSNRFDQLLPAKYCIDGYSDFASNILPGYIRENIIIYDIGGGKNPYMTNEMKLKLNCKVIGIDIDKNELDMAPKDAYDDIISADITEYKGIEDGDLAICLALLEHA